MSLRLERLQRLLGADISLEQTINILQRLGFEPYLKDAFTIDVSIPSYRRDIAEEIDLIEESARLYGYENIPVKMPEGMISRYACPQYLTEKDAFSNKLREIMKGQGITEIISYSFISQKDIESMSFKGTDPRIRMVRVKNPLIEGQSVMRTSLVPSLLMAISVNHAQRNMDLKLFEIGKVFHESAQGELPVEEQRIASAWTGMRYPDSWNLSREKADLFDMKGLMEEALCSLNIYDWRVALEEQSEPFYAPYNCASIFTCKDICIGTFGEISRECIEAFDIASPVFVLDISLDALYSMPKVMPRYKAISRYPSMERDISIILPENIYAQGVLDYIEQKRHSLLESTRIFDIYKGRNIPEGKKSMGIRLTYRSELHTLTENDIASIHESLTKELLDHFNACLRT
jgi:phenylalanyl-tRNA synthetase beta chain